jgi:hypothetical protein
MRIITASNGRYERMGSDSTEAVAPPPSKSESRHREFYFLTSTGSRKGSTPPTCERRTRYSRASGHGTLPGRLAATAGRDGPDARVSRYRALMRSTLQ